GDSKHTACGRAPIEMMPPETKGGRLCPGKLQHLPIILCQRHPDRALVELSSTGRQAVWMSAQQRSLAFRFLIMIGIANLFADFTYECARSVTGPSLSQLGASAAIVSIAAGVGEFVGYGLRAASGPLADRTGRYWTFTLIGYAINVLAVPALAFAGSW